MLEQIKLLSSRRAYEFRADDLRLSLMSLKPMQEQIQHLFQFQTSAMGTPVATFGDVPITYPPGFVFNMGTWITQDTRVVPIRLLHFEQRRIVIDVSGPSSTIDAIYEQLLRFLSVVQSPDGSPIIGEPERILEYSVISAQFPFPVEVLIAPSLRKLFNGVLRMNAQTNNTAIVPTIVVQNQMVGQEITKIAAPEDSFAFTIGPRVGTKPEDNMYLSCAPLDSEAHLSFLNELEADFNRVAIAMRASNAD